MNKTFAYFNLFNHPLTYLEAKRWSWHGLTPNPSPSRQGGMERSAEVRIKKYKIAEKKWKKVEPYLKILSNLPAVKALFVCNRLAWWNTDENSDIDLFIIAQKNKIWTTRFFTTGLAKILNLRPTPQKTKDKICLTFYITEDNLNLEKYKACQPDVHFIYWLNQMVPVYDPFNLYKKLLIWTKKYLPYIYPYDPTMRRRIRTFFLKKIFDLIPGEKIYKAIQLKILPEKLKKLANKNNNVIIQDNILKFHDQDKRVYYQNLWQQRLAESSSMS